MTRLSVLITFALVVMILLFWSCNSTKQVPATEEVAVRKANVPDWHKNATIYEVNLRHFTPEGTINAFREHLPRLKELGIDILWFMPVQPVSAEKRKGELGSPYAVGNYTAINPDYGTMDDFRAMLTELHDLGMHCIIDWVPNHTGWDNPWITEHPEWYTQDADGNIVDPLNAETGESWGWTDVADLNYDVPEMRLAMIDAMRFWIEDVGIDGFRVDVAHSVPADFFKQCTEALYAIRPVFMLAEAEVPELRNSGSFIMDYAWEMHHLLNQIAKTQGASRSQTQALQQGNLVESDGAEVEPHDATDIDRLLAEKAAVYEQGYQMQFTSNHDENSWAGTEFERMGDGHQAFAVLTATFNGMPLIYTGMESAMDKRLEFFTKDEVPWGDYSYADFYSTLFNLKHRNQALWNGEYGGALVKVPTGNDKHIYAFTREKNGDRVLVMINLSSKTQSYNLKGKSHLGTFTNAFTGEQTTIAANYKGAMEPWQYVVLHTEASN